MSSRGIGCVAGGGMTKDTTRPIGERASRASSVHASRQRTGVLRGDRLRSPLVGRPSRRAAGGHAPSKASAPAAASAALRRRPRPRPPSSPPTGPIPPGAPAPHGARGMVVTDDARSRPRSASTSSPPAATPSTPPSRPPSRSRCVFPTAGNIGGGGFLVARVGGKAYALDFRETAPAAATRDMYLGRRRQADARLARGLALGGRARRASPASGRRGTRSARSEKTWAELLAPAIALADHGFVVDAAVRAGHRHDLQGRLAKYPASAALFLPDGAPPAVGSTWRNPRARRRPSTDRRRGAARLLRGAGRRGDRARHEGRRRPRHARTTSRPTAPSGAPPIDYTYRGRERHRHAAAVVGRPDHGDDRAHPRRVRPPRHGLALRPPRCTSRPRRCAAPSPRATRSSAIRTS